MYTLGASSVACHGSNPPRTQVKSLTNPEYVAAEKGAPPLVGNLLASLIARGLPSGMEFGRYSIDYHYLRNSLYVRDRMPERQAESHVPAYARGIMSAYNEEMEGLRAAAAATSTTAGDRGRLIHGATGAAGAAASAAAWVEALREALFL